MAVASTYVRHSQLRTGSPAPAAYGALAALGSLLAALVVAVIGSGALPWDRRSISVPGAGGREPRGADRRGRPVQLLLGTALIFMAVSLGRYLGTDGLVGSMAMIAGVVGGAAFVAAGAIQQETVFYALFVDSKQTGELALAAGVTDLTGFNLLISVVAGGMRSAGSYAVGLAWIGWAVIGARSGDFRVP